MCNCSGAYPQYYNNYSQYQGYGGSYPQTYPQYGSYEGCCGTYPQYYYYPVSQYPAIVVNSSSVEVNPTPVYPVIVNPTPIVVNPTPIVVNPTPVVVNPTPVVVNPTHVVVNPPPQKPVSMRGEYRVGNCLIICNK